MRYLFSNCQPFFFYFFLFCFYLFSFSFYIPKRFLAQLLFYSITYNISSFKSTTKINRNQSFSFFFFHNGFYPQLEVEGSQEAPLKNSPTINGRRLKQYYIKRSMYFKYRISQSIDFGKTSTIRLGLTTLNGVNHIF